MTANAVPTAMPAFAPVLNPPPPFCCSGVGIEVDPDPDADADADADVAAAELESEEAARVCCAKIQPLNWIAAAVVELSTVVLVVNQAAALSLIAYVRT